jgi:nitrate reductase (NAD(P)H)
MMVKHHIGSLSEASRLALSNPIIDSSITETRETFLNPRSWVTSSLIAKNVVSWDTKLFIFKLDHETQRIGLPVGQHLLLKIKDPKGDETVVRAYTPVSSDKRLGVVELLVKIYFDTPTSPGGKMTQAMNLLRMCFPLYSV